MTSCYCCGSLKWLHWKAGQKACHQTERGKTIIVQMGVILWNSLSSKVLLLLHLYGKTQKNVQSVWRYEEKDTFCLLSYHLALRCSQPWPEVGKLSSRKKKVWREREVWTLTSLFFCLKRTLACSGLVWFVWSGQNFFNCEEKWEKDELISKGSN